jgi:hypothetical protein
LKKLLDSLSIAVLNEGELRGTTAAFLVKAKVRRAEVRQDGPMALPHEDTASPRNGMTGLQYKFQGYSATVT